jgi:hypothetical protein
MNYTGNLEMLASVSSVWRSCSMSIEVHLGREDVEE